MPKSIHSNLKPRPFVVIKTANPSKLSAMNCTLLREHFTAGRKNTVPSKGQTAPTPKEFDAISGRLAKREREMEIIHLSQCVANIPLQKRLSILENLYRQSNNA